jgi:serine O-acetyltransferase
VQADFMDSAESINWSIPNWEREKPTRFWDPSRKLLKSIRQYQALKKSNIPFKTLLSKLVVLRYRFWCTITGAEIDLSCQIGGGLLIPHPNGIVIHPGSIIGANCMIFQQVTLAGIVELGYHVDIGAGAKILGPLKIENHVRVGANAVVTKDVAEGDTVVGIPAKSINKEKIAI